MMKAVYRFLVTVLCLIMLVSSFPVSVFASNSTYTVTLMAGPEGQGSAYTLTKTAGEPLSLAHFRADIIVLYGLQPKGGSSDKRVFIKWSTSYDEKTGRGTGTDYFDTYDADADVTLYAIWGYPIMFNADGGRFADGSTRKLEYVADYAEWTGESTDPRSMYRYSMPDWNGDVPVKEGARRVGNSAGPDGKGYAYGLIREDGKSFFTWEGYGENLTIPPTGGIMAWSNFRCVSVNDPDNPYSIAFPEFMAIWEPSVTYDPNGGEGESYSEYRGWGWSKLWTYERYTIADNSFTHPEGAEFLGWNTKPDGSGRNYAEGTQVTNLGAASSDPVTLYAQWEARCEHSYSEWTDVNENLRERICTICGHTEQEAIGDEKKADQIIVSYFNVSAAPGTEDFTNIDVLNYHPATVTVNALSHKDGEPIVTHTYSERLDMWKERAYKFNPDIKFVFTVANGNINDFESWFTTPDRAKKLANEMLAIIEQYGYDGLDIDYEFPGSGNTPKNNYVRFMQYMREGFDALSAENGKEYILSMAVPAGDWAFSLFKMNELAEYVSYFNIMSYDLHVGNDTKGITHHHTNPCADDNALFAGASVEEDIALYLEKGIPADKIVAGIGMYARRWTDVPDVNNGLYQSGTLDETSSEAYLHYSLIKASYENKNGYVKYWDDVAKAPYLYNASKGVFLSYEDEESAKIKAELAVKNEICGVMVYDYVTTDGIGFFDNMRTWLDETVRHYHDYTEDVLQASTCTETGLSLMLCTCGEYYIENIPVIPHLFENYTYNNDATCTADGTKTAYCEYGCGASDTVIAKGTTSHSYVEEIIRSATCTKTGILMMICDCGAYYTEDIPNLAHSYTDYTYNNDATCTADGTMTAYCDYGCGNMDTLTAEGTISDHDYVGSVTKEATCTATGIMTYICRYCRAGYTETIAKTEHNYIPDVIKAPTCTSTGMILYMCWCRDYYTEVVQKAEHPFGDWTTVTAPTDSSVGEERRECTVCGAEEIRELPILPKPELTVNNYTVTITNADYIKDARYVLGTYTTTTEIRNAEGNVALDNKVIKNHTVDGKFVYDLPDGGVYSIWVRMTDGRNYILNVDMTKFTPKVTIYGVKITVDGLYDAKDFFIAKGRFNSYNEIKNNGYIVRVTENKIAGKHSYTYTVSDPGMHTVLVRYNDGTENIFHEELTVDEPTFTTNGLQVTVGNIPDVKVIRTAYGEYYTPGDTKRAEGARNFSNKAVIKDAETYMLQYREEGRVTIIVEYNNGYVKVFHYDVVKKAPTVEQNENSVTFGNLEGLVMIRYAVGEYTTSAEIKRAPGSKVIKPDAIVDGKITVSDLDEGTYTFCVQYDDDSYCYYQSHIKVEQKDFTLNFNAEDGALVNNADLTYGINIGDKYSDIITELPVAEKEGYVFKGWWNRQRRIAITPDFDAQEVFDVYLKEGENLEYIDTTIELIPIWDTEGEKDWTLTFVNWEIDFEPIEIGMNVGDTFMSVFGGKFPDPGEKVIDFGDGDLYEFQGWMIDDPDIGVFLLTEGDMWDLGYLALAGNWVFEALYELV